MPTERLLPRLFLFGLLALLALAAWQWRHGPPLSTDLMELVPGAPRDALQQQAEQRMQEPLNRELLVLLGYPQREQATEAAQRLERHWQGSGAFESVQGSLQADLPALRRQLLNGRLALLGEDDRRQLIEQPRAFIQQRVQSLFDTFAGSRLLASDEDWFGLAERIQNHQQPQGALQVDLASGALLVETQGLQWALVRARTRADAFDLDLPLQVEALVDAARRETEANGGRLLAASGLLHAAASQRQATREMSWIGGGASLGAVLLLLLAFRRVRVLLAILPVACGLLGGAVACVALFGQIHVITLVLGGSLIGVAIDPPLHYLSKSWALRPWSAWGALRATLPGLALSLATNLIGYLALAFAPFPALKQIAVFSAAGLLTAFLCTLCLLPALFAGLDLSPRPAPLILAERIWGLRQHLLWRAPSAVLLALLLAFCASGLWRLNLPHDLRQWVATSPPLLDEANAIARLTGQRPTSQFFLVHAADQQQLLERQARLSLRLDALIADGRLGGYLALSQLIAPAAQQERLRQALDRLPEHWQPLLDLGVPREALERELETLRKLPVLDIPAALAGPLGEAWRPLWLGESAGGVAGLVSLQGLHDANGLSALNEGLDGVRLIDRLGQLNRSFTAAQWTASELKLLSCALIVALLSLPFGLRGAVRVVALPLLSATAALATLGWVGQPLTLFGLFGLLLVTAIGVDYAILMRERVGGAAVSLLGNALAAFTTWLSFGLLALSSTPAVSNFGLAVSLGLVFSFLLAPWAGEGHRRATGGAQ